MHVSVTLIGFHMVTSTVSGSYLQRKRAESDEMGWSDITSQSKLRPCVFMTR